MAQSLSSADHPLSNSAARADTIREAVRWLAEREAEVKALNAEIREYKQKHVKGDLGFKLSDWIAVYRVSQLEVEDRDQLIDTFQEGMAALGIQLDWLAGAPEQHAPQRSSAPRRPRGRPRKQPDLSLANGQEQHPADDHADHLEH
jgi:hypothetical protein